MEFIWLTDLSKSHNLSVWNPISLSSKYNFQIIIFFGKKLLMVSQETRVWYNIFISVSIVFVTLKYFCFAFKQKISRIIDFLKIFISLREIWWCVPSALCTSVYTQNWKIKKQKVKKKKNDEMQILIKILQLLIFLLMKFRQQNILPSILHHSDIK